MAVLLVFCHQKNPSDKFIHNFGKGFAFKIKKEAANTWSCGYIYSC